MTKYEATVPDTIPEMSTHLSAVPDLLWEHVRDRRVAEIAPFLEHPERIDDETPFDRVTVFLTYGCQLRCVFCKTIARSDQDLRLFPQKATAFDLAAFTDLLVQLPARRVKHLHFTGGEATLVAALPAMVRLARERGIPHVSITSNGAVAWPRIQALVDSGISELRISVHAREPLLAAQVSERPHAWRAALNTVERLADLRRSGASFFLIVNTVITHANRHDALDIVRFLLGLGVDDIKLIADVDQTGTLGAFAGSTATLHAIEQLLTAHPPHAFPLLRRKLQTVFSPDAVGLRHVDRTRGEDWRCYIPLTERTVDRLYYYPCSVYLREGGAPLGRIDEPAAAQRRSTVEFVRNGRCLEDPICRRYCLRCTGTFNAAANAARPSPSEDSL